MPLLEIIGVSPVGKNFTIVVAFMSRENEKTYAWALEKLRELLDGVEPYVILTDQELGLLKALPNVFPASYHMLCLFHINKNVEANATKFMGGNKKRVTIFWRTKWEDLVNSETVEEYESNYNKMVRVIGGNTRLLDYLNDTWFIHKEKFVKAWTNDACHFGNTTTNRVESAHSSSKGWFASSTGGIDTVQTQLRPQVSDQVNELKVDIALSGKIRLHCACFPCFEGLICNVTHEALKKLDVERKSAMKMQDSMSCTHYLRRTHGLLCACKIVKKIRDRDSFYAEDLHSFWSTMTVEGSKESSSQPGRNESLKNQFRFLSAEIMENEDYVTLKNTVDYMRSNLHPDTIHLEESSHIKPKVRPKNNPTKRDSSHWEYVLGKVKSVSASRGRKTSTGETPESKPGRGRGRGRGKSTEESTTPLDPRTQGIDLYSFLPQYAAQSVVSYVNVAADGNCGYRCVAELMYRNEEKWSEVRRDLITELYERFDLYVNLNGHGETGRSHVAAMISRCTWREGPSLYEKWMSFPDLGHVIATRYNAMVVLLTPNASTTYLPLAGRPDCSQIICLILMGAHFVVGHLLINCPLPPLNRQWRYYVENNLAHLYEVYESRFDLWIRLRKQT